MTAEEESFPRSTSSKPRRRNRARGGSKPSESSALNKDKKSSETSKEAKITKKMPSDSTDKDAPVESKKAQTSISSSNEKKKKKQKKGRGKKNSIPKPGEEGYMTPTQLRNARKRRAKERGKSNDDDNDNEKNSNDEAKITTSTEKNEKSSKTSNNKDPSMKYIANPRSAPIIRHANKYFTSLKSQYPIKPFEVFLGPTNHWRTVSKLAVRKDASSKVQIGLFVPNTHDLLPIPNCKAHHPSINLAVEAVRKACDKLSVEPYNEESGVGFFRYLAINVERKTGKAQLTLVWNSEPYNEEEDEKNNGQLMLNRLTNELLRVGRDRNIDGDTNNTDDPPKRKRRRGKQGAIKEEKLTEHSSISPPENERFVMHSLWVHFNASWKHSNAIFDYSPSSSTWKHIYGPKAIVDSLDLNDTNSPSSPPLSLNVQLNFPPNVFRQANIDAFTAIVSRIRSRIYQYTEGKKKGVHGSEDLPSCIELYGGVGTIGLNICDLTSNLISSDENPHNEKCFNDSVSKFNDLSFHDRVKYIPKNATDMAQQKSVFGDKSLNEIIVVDPPRKGLDDAVRKALTDDLASSSKDGPQLLVYVSCGFNAFERDCNVLLESGKWAIDHAEGHLLFPGSDAIETLAFFVRK
mmetsp:Transcript_24226/g.35598  ORF Transcript_24226/g.35598 Transcript_24226/m.35598 type:complete len:632 (+) Transcript_24226:65-1960(+)